MILLVKLCFLTVFLLVLNYIFRRGGAWLGFGVFTVLPVCLTPWWLVENPDIGLFEWAKLYSVVIAITWMNLARFTELGRKTWWRQGVACLLVINIFEAMLQDAAGNQLAHWLVVISGVLLVVTLPSFRKSIQIDLDSPKKDMTYRDMNRKWIIEYSVWNWAFVYLNFPEIAGHQIAVLAASAIFGLIWPNLWLQTRGYTLGADLILLATFPRVMIEWTNTEYWSSPTRELIVATVCLVIVLGYSIRFVQLQRQKWRVTHQSTPSLP